jgi:hypothetical protein
MEESAGRVDPDRLNEIKKATLATTDSFRRAIAAAAFLDEHVYEAIRAAQIEWQKQAPTPEELEELRVHRDDTKLKHQLIQEQQAEVLALLAPLMRKNREALAYNRPLQREDEEAIDRLQRMRTKLLESSVRQLAEQKALGAHIAEKARARHSYFLKQIKELQQRVIELGQHGGLEP